jgi:Rad3-related DNA helicase
MASRSDILSYFQGTPRPQQTEALREIQARWREADVFLVRAPVATGKSRMAACVTAWAGAGGIVTPTNNLVAQYAADFPDLATIGLRSSYGNSSDWAEAKAAFHAAPRFVANYFTYLAHRNYRRVMVFDEAHRLVPTLQDQEAIRLWDHEYKVPDWVTTTTDLQAWAEDGAGSDPKLSRLADRLASHPDTYCVDVGWDSWRGRTERCWTLRPLTPRLNRPLLWPNKVKKLILMSATLYPEDLWELGLETRRVATIQVGSPIPPERRPVVYNPCYNPSFATRAAEIPALKARIEALAERHRGERGFVHTTYAIAAELAAAGLGSHPRFWFHTPQNASARYHQWLRAGADGVFVGCGMSEGLDLAGDLARWQVITKVGYPSKADPAVLAKMAVRPDWYTTTAVREFEQAVGRVCRGPDDYGVTYVLTEEFPNLWRRGQQLGLWSPSLVPALNTEGT